MIKRDQAFEVENGVVFDEDGPGIFAESVVPAIEGGEVFGDRLLTDDGNLHRFENEWVVDFNFSQKNIPTGTKVKVGPREEMRVQSQLRVDGFLRIDGQVYVENKVEVPPAPILPDDNFSFYHIPSGQTVTVPDRQEMNLSSFVRVDGFLNVQGRMSVLSKPAVEVPPKRVPKIIQAGQSFEVLEFEEYQFRGWMRVDGQYNNKGFVYIN
jgi:hypothetical protein